VRFRLARTELEPPCPFRRQAGRSASAQANETVLSSQTKGGKNWQIGIVEWVADHGWAWRKRLDTVLIATGRGAAWLAR
jgi:hypothetical protein